MDIIRDTSRPGSHNVAAVLTLFSRLSLWIACISFLAALFIGCEEQKEGRSVLFQKIMKVDSAAFRGTQPKDPLSMVRDLEAESSLLYEDEIGLSYQVTISDDCIMYLEYFSDRLIKEDPQGLISSISANILLSDEVQTAQLYNEISDYFSFLYGVSSGFYGNRTWNGLTNRPTGMEIHLKMEDNKKGITINFVDIEPESVADSAK